MIVVFLLKLILQCFKLINEAKLFYFLIVNSFYFSIFNTSLKESLYMHLFSLQHLMKL